MVPASLPDCSKISYRIYCQFQGLFRCLYHCGCCYDLFIVQSMVIPAVPASVLWFTPCFRGIFKIYRTCDGGSTDFASLFPGLFYGSLQGSRVLPSFPRISPEFSPGSATDSTSGARTRNPIGADDHNQPGAEMKRDEQQKHERLARDR